MESVLIVFRGRNTQGVINDANRYLGDKWKVVPARTIVCADEDDSLREATDFTPGGVREELSRVQNAGKRVEFFVICNGGPTGPMVKVVVEFVQKSVAVEDEYTVRSWRWLGLDLQRDKVKALCGDSNLLLDAANPDLITR